MGVLGDGQLWGEISLLLLDERVHTGLVLGQIVLGKGRWLLRAVMGLMCQTVIKLVWQLRLTIE